MKVRLGIQEHVFGPVPLDACLRDECGLSVVAVVPLVFVQCGCGVVACEDGLTMVADDAVKVICGQGARAALGEGETSEWEGDSAGVF